MKKIIGTAVLAVLAAGAVFAEPKITLNYRTRANLYKYSETAGENKTSTMFDLKGYGSAKDTLSTSVTTDYAGVTCDINWTATVDTPEVDAYSGWLKFGALKFTSGNFSSRFTDRINVRKTQIGLTDGDTAKYGISNKVSAMSKEDSGTTIGYDADNISFLPDSKLSLFADYTFSDLPGKLLVKAGLVNYQYKNDKTSTDDVKKQNAGYAFEAAYEADNFALDAILKLPTEKSLVFGAYATLGMIPNAKAALGFTYANDGAAPDYDKGTAASIFGKTTKWSAFAIDGRVKYAVTDAANVVFQAKFTSIKPNDNLDAQDKDDAQTALELVAEVSYVVNDLIAVALDGGVYMCDLDNSDDVKACQNYFILNPAVQFTAGKGATLAAGLEYKQALDSSKDDFGTGIKSQIQIPCVLRVKL